MKTNIFFMIVLTVLGIMNAIKLIVLFPMIDGLILFAAMFVIFMGGIYTARVVYKIK